MTTPIATLPATTHIGIVRRALEAIRGDYFRDRTMLAAIDRALESLAIVEQALRVKEAA